MERISEEGEWRKSKRRRTTTRTAEEIVNQWTKSTDCTWMEEVKTIEEVNIDNQKKENRNIINRFLYLEFYCKNRAVFQFSVVTTTRSEIKWQIRCPVNAT
jgi:hypothetical protein